MRLRIDLAYDGTGFHGWATQPGLRTVQGVVEEALKTLLGVDHAALTCAGRTDTGVHARGQVCHLDVSAPIASPDRLGRRLNRLLPHEIRVRACTVASPDFDARFSALWRRYTYRIVDDATVADPLIRRSVLWWPRPLDPGLMASAAELALGAHDFAAFCRRREGATTVRTMLELTCVRDDTGMLLVTPRADAFCHHMVRSLVGALVAVGEGRRSVDWVGDLLGQAQRDSGVTVLPAHGLTLEEVAYPAEDALAGPAEHLRTVRTGG